MESSITTMLHAVRGYFRFAHIDGGAGVIIRAHLHQIPTHPQAQLERNDHLARHPQGENLLSRLLSHLVPLAAVAGVSLSMLAAPAALAAPGNSGAAKACQNGGFARFQGTDGSRFADEGGCVRYAARGGMLAPVSTLTFVADPTPGYCDVILTLSGAPNTLYSVDAYTTPLGYSLNGGAVLTDAAGSYSQMILPELAGSTIFVTVDGVSITSPVAC